jgi:hypothetical protein
VQARTVKTPLDLVQEAATKTAAELSDPLALATRGSAQFSLVFRLLRERAAGDEYRFGGTTKDRIRAALLEILAVVKRLDERVE